MKRLGLPSLVLLVVFLGISGFAAIGVYTFKQDVASMRSASQEDISWTATQLELELARFREALLSFQIEGSGVGAAEVNTRFDILWSRVALFREGRVGERLAVYESQSNVVTNLFDRMKEVDREVVGLTTDDRAKAAGIFARFDEFPPLLSRLSREVTLGEETRGREIRESLEAGVNRTLILFGLATAVALFAVAYINRESLKYKRLARLNRQLANAAESASLAKSQFLTMMSHELRTPMNGVLGLLALTKQNETQPRQRNLIQQAEQSAQQMVALLADILDFSALQADDIELDSRPFEIRHLAKAVGDRFAPMARREGVDFDVEVASDCPARVRADFRRLRQAFSHLTQYIVETAGTRRAFVEFACSDDCLTMTLTFEYASEGGEWDADLILGAENRGADKFATDALGPAIARGLVEKMNGSIRVHNPGGNRISVEARIPVELFDVSTLNVEIYASSEAMGAICRAALKGDNIAFCSNEDTCEVHIVLIESGNGSENDYLNDANRRHPNALFVALGRPVNSESFDFIIDLPLDFQELRQIVYRQIA